MGSGARYSALVSSNVSPLRSLLRLLTHEGEVGDQRLGYD